MFHMSHGSLRQTMLMVMLVIFLVSITGFSSAQAGIRKNYLENRLQASIGWRGNRTMTMVDANSHYFNLGVSGGFEFMATYKPAEYVHCGFVLTNYAKSSPDNRLSGYDLSQTQFGLTAIIASPWTQLTSKSKRWHYRGKIGGILDATGFKVSPFGPQSQGTELGRIHEHRIFASFEVGIKCFGTEGSGILFGRITYARSLYGYGAGGSSIYDFDSGSNNHIYFDLGLSI